MLDQNTDRMWYVIGAVIVGAALIFLMNSSMPSVFANVADIFKEKTDEVSEVVSDIGGPTKEPGLFGSHTASFHSPVTTKTLDAKTDIWTLTAVPSVGLNQVIYVMTFSDMHTAYVPYGESLTITYDVYSEEGLSTWNDVSNYPVDESRKDTTWFNGNDNDLDGPNVSQGDRNMSVVQNVPAKQWTTIKLHYINNSTKNTHEYDLRDASMMGVYNKSNNPMTFKIRNIKAVRGM